MVEIVTETNLPIGAGVQLPRGKVRDIYDLDDKLLIVTTDRISAFDYVLPNAIPYKGKCLNQLSKFWFDYFDHISNHTISTDPNEYPDELQEYASILKGRSMLVKKVEPVKAECIVRGYISGSAWESYKKDGTVCGIKLPSGLKESEKFDEPLFTPSTKAPEGKHDINISFKELEKLIGPDVADTIREWSLEIYSEGAIYARDKGVIIADTKFEFGKLGDEIILIDEVLTPDSSRFWPADDYEPGRSQNSFDKQYVRDWLKDKSGWDRNSPPPELPSYVVLETTNKYKEAFQKITGRKLA